MKHKVLSFDLDGTLLNRDGEIMGGQETIDCLHYIHDLGYDLIINTGRLDHDIYHIIERYKLPIDIRISQNGAVVISEEKLTATLINKKEALDIYEMIKKENIRVELNTVSQRYWLGPRPKDFAKELYDSSNIVDDFRKIIKYQPCVLFLLIGKTEELKKIQSKVNSSFTKVDAVMTSNTSLEIIPKDVSKGKALRSIYNNMELYSIGDSENDYSMFKDAKRSYLIGGKNHPNAKNVKCILEALQFIIDEIEE